MPIIAANTEKKSFPLCVDLDGTLIRTDVLWESFLLLVKRNPLYLLVMPFWLARGRATLKKQIAARTDLNATHLPYHLPFLEYLKTERAQGRTLILATASDDRLAQIVSRHLGLFSDVVASNGGQNMRGKNKRDLLAQRYGKKGFDYAGNSTVDLPVWEQSRQAIVVNAGKNLVQRARGVTEVSHIFESPGSSPAAVIKAFRPHQWVKNLIIFVPLLTAHNFANPPLLWRAFLALMAFCLCASGGYVLNDLCDLEADRQHARKRFRPFASGQLPLPVGFALAGLTLAASLVVALWLSRSFAFVLLVYFILTSSYSFRIKQIAVLDVFFIAGLYTMRLIAGHTATDIACSFWLPPFSLFIFLSLALLKRFTELNVLPRQNQGNSSGSVYTINDLELVAMLGIASGFLSVLVMALYVNSEAAQSLYKYPNLLLLICPLVLYWISRIWMIGHRGQMHDDPVVFALKDPASYLIGVLTLGVLWLATGHYDPIL